MTLVEKAKNPSWANSLRSRIEENVLSHVEDLAGEVEELINKFDSGKGPVSSQADKLFESLEAKVEGMTDVQTGRLWTDSQIEVRADRGFSEYISVSMRDDLVCEFCDEMDGQSFTVENAIDRIVGEEEREFLNVDDLEDIDAMDET